MKLNLNSIFESIDARKKSSINHNKIALPSNIISDSIMETEIRIDLSEKYNNGKPINFDDINDMLFNKQLSTVDFQKKQREFVEIIESFLLQRGMINNRGYRDGILNTFPNRRATLKNDGIYFENSVDAYNGILSKGFFYIFFPCHLDNMNSPINYFRIKFAINQIANSTQGDIDFGLQMPDKEFKPSTFLHLLHFIANMINLVDSAQFTSIFTMVKKLKKQSLQSKIFATTIENTGTTNIRDFAEWDFFDYDNLFQLLIIVFYIMAFHEKNDYYVLNYDTLVSYIINDNPYKLKYFNTFDKTEKELFMNTFIQTYSTTVKLQNYIPWMKGKTFPLTDFFASLLYENKLLPYNPHKKGLIRKVSVLNTLNKFFGPTEIMSIH